MFLLYLLNVTLVGTTCSMCNGSDIEVNHRLRVRYRYRYPGSVFDTLSEMIPSAKPPPQLLDLTHALVTVLRKG